MYKGNAHLDVNVLGESASHVNMLLYGTLVHTLGELHT